MRDFDSPSAQERQHHADQRERRDEQTARWADDWSEPVPETCPECGKDFTTDERLVAITLGGRTMHEDCYYAIGARQSDAPLVFGTQCEVAKRRQG